MRTSRLILLPLTVISLSWYAMMATHELGHVLAGLATGGSVERVVLHPFSISRTDLNANPYPGIVVWSGPTLGSVIPLLLRSALPDGWSNGKALLRFVAGFCLVANGTYIGMGSFELIGDCHQMAATGTPRWVMWIFGLTATAIGLRQWHLLGPAQRLFSGSALVPQRLEYSLYALLAIICLGGLLIAKR